ncbi:MAG: GNAT family N-acetyltransferase [Halanaerobiales bacterium]|nr:GNAT family N-acetyltransferase [Halanaerobiales bacterium]
MKKDELLELLKEDPIKNMSLIGFVENNELDQIYKYKSSLLIIGESDHLWVYPKSDDKDELLKLISDIEITTKYFANLEDWMLAQVINDREVEWILKTQRYYYPEYKKIKQPINKVGSLRYQDIDIIIKHSEYSEHLSYNLLKKRIDNGLSAAIRIDDKLIAWGLTHDDKSLGFLHVIKEYRNKGYAKDIGRYLIKEKQKLNEIAYINIEPDNNKSINLSTGLGFKYDRNISWLKLK